MTTRGPPRPYRPHPHRSTSPPAKPRTIVSLTHPPTHTTLPPAFTGRATSVESYEKLNRIGEGTYGIVYRARHRASGAIVALKRIRIEEQTEGMPLSSLREISLLKKIRHENVVEVRDVVVGNELENIFMVMEYCQQDMGNLMDNVISKGPSPGYTDAEVKCLMIQLLDGLAYLHDNYIIHRDLKMTNLLLTSAGVLKIADFGLARTFSLPPTPMTPKVVTLWYRAPELLLGEKTYTTAIDMWSVGCILGELLLCRPLLPGKSERHQLVLTTQLLGTPTPRIWPALPTLPHASAITSLPTVPYSTLASTCRATDAAHSLLMALLTYDPARRSSVHTARAAKWWMEHPPPCAKVLLPTYPEPRNEDAGKRERERRGKEKHKHHEQQQHHQHLSPLRKQVKRPCEEPTEWELGAPAFKQFCFS
ncbi:cyclin-dependent kinase 10 [Powellomyces hirtus]|nr:cyclin-dependent kinase 10 [Powellomyces hirtus]